MEFPEQNKKGKKYLKNQVKLTKETLYHLLQHIIPKIQTFSHFTSNSNKPTNIREE